MTVVDATALAARPLESKLDRITAVRGKRQMDRSTALPVFYCSMPSSSFKPRTKFLARPADTMIPNASASLNSADVAPASFAPAKALRSQVGQPAATAHPAWMSLRVFASSTSSYSKSTWTLFRVVMISPSSSRTRAAPFVSRTFFRGLTFGFRRAPLAVRRPASRCSAAHAIELHGCERSRPAISGHRRSITESPHPRPAIPIAGR
jgi:hypothetical protein